MSHRLRRLLMASGVLFLPATVLQSRPAQSQASFDISFNAFHDQLSNSGDWVYSDRWGEVWRPMQQDQDPNWRPYSVGHWVNTDEYGWTWVSEEGPWGDVVYHYGRWVNDPDAGWLWLTGYIWSPAWVAWRSAGPNVGWMPMPPDDAFLGYSNPGMSVNVSFGNWTDVGGFYGYSNWYGPQFSAVQFEALWIFVPLAHAADPVYRNYAFPRAQVVNLVQTSHNITNYTIVNNYIVNKSVTVNMVQAAGGHAIAPVHAAAAMRTNRWVVPVTKGQTVQAQMRQATPRGNGAANSAPKPSPIQIATLSTRPLPARGSGGRHAAAHLFSQANVVQLQSKAPANGIAKPAVAPTPKPAANTGPARRQAPAPVAATPAQRKAVLSAPPHAGAANPKPPSRQPDADLTQRQNINRTTTATRAAIPAATPVDRPLAPEPSHPPVDQQPKVFTAAPQPPHLTPQQVSAPRPDLAASRVPPKPPAPSTKTALPQKSEKPEPERRDNEKKPQE